jgi:hypothetical protein
VADNPLSTTVNKPNVASLVTILVPFLAWCLNRFVLKVPLTETEIMSMSTVVTACAVWVSTYFTNNKPKQPGD